MESLFLSKCIEFEEGWGSRPDGTYIAKTLEDLKKHISEDEERGSYGMFWRYDEPIEVFCEEETYLSILEKMSKYERKVISFTNKELKEFKLFKHA